MKKIISVLLIIVLSSAFVYADEGTTSLGTGTHILNVDGYEALLYIPESAPARFMPLVVNLHPSSGTGEN